MVPTSSSRYLSTALSIHLFTPLSTHFTTALGELNNGKSLLGRKLAARGICTEKLTSSTGCSRIALVSIPFSAAKVEVYLNKHIDYLPKLAGLPC